MKALPRIAILFGLFAALPLAAQTTPPATTPPGPGGSIEDKDRAYLNKHVTPILDALKLDDAKKQLQVRDILTAYFLALQSWHNQNDARLKELWNAFNDARAHHDDAKADQCLADIDTLYSSFKPPHDLLVEHLAAALTPAQIETVKDVITINKVGVTFHAYGEIFHGLTDAQREVILKNLKAAREEAITAGSMTEKSAFFKKYKIRIEAYLTAQGYDVKQSYREFVAKQKATTAGSAGSKEEVAP